MAAYKKLVVKSYPRLSSRETSDNKFWKKYNFPITVKEFSAINCISFSGSTPHDFAVTTSNKVQLYSSTTNDIKKTFTKFKNTAYGGCLRGDGKLLVAGCEDGTVKIFNVESRVVLRQYTGHTGAVHCTKFSSDGLRVFSGSDDYTVRLWDVASEDELFQAKEHKDYIRSCTFNTSSKDLWLTGSYDHTLKLWDTRTQSSIMSMNHGYPVESVVIFPSGGLCASAGHNVVKIWDLLGGGRLVSSFSNHQKTITSLCFDGQFTRLLSASLDRHVKIYDVVDYKVVHSITYPSPILCMGLSPDDKHLVVGMSDGLLSIKHRKPRSSDEPAITTKQPTPGTYRYFVRGKNQKPGQDDVVINESRKPGLKHHDRLLKTFDYTKALDHVLRPGMQKVDVITSMMMELIRRDGLKTALSGRDDDELVPLLTFLNKYISHPRYSSTLIDVTEMVLDIYAPVLGHSPKVDDLITKLNHKVRSEIQFQKQVFELMGALDTIFAVSTSGRSSIQAR